MKRVRVGQKYIFEPGPVSWDRVDPPYNVKPGDVVEVVKLPGCPPPGTMGHCHVNVCGEFGGLVQLSSLKPYKNQ